ncbi:MAG TPA: membrane protein insertase YidC [Acidimicrobiales bacterium]|nr:membrane protein insertase YidC [Acidimicrobiales bacterium]
MTALSQLVAWVLAGFYALIPNYGIAIILLGLTFMILVVPLTLKSTRSMLAMQKLQPKMKQLQQQYKNDRLALNQALTELYKEEGVSPFGSCIPTLLPLPLFYVLYRVITGLSNKGPSGCKGTACHAMPLYVNPGTAMYKALVASAAPGEGAQMHAFGINLSVSAWTALTKGLGFAEIFGSLLLLLIMIGANYYQQVQITNLNPMVRQNQQMNSQMQIMRFFPVVFGLICIRLPSGLVVYYAVSALFRVGQQWMMYHYDPKVIALVAKDDRDIEVMEARLDETEKRKSRPTGRPPQPGLPPSKPSQAKPSQAKPSQAQPSQSKPSQSKPPQARPAQAGSSQAGSSQGGSPQAGSSQSGPAESGSPQTGTAAQPKSQQNGPAQGKAQPARMPQVKQPKPVPAGDDAAPTDGKTNGQVPSRNPSSQAGGQRNRSRRRKGR